MGKHQHHQQHSSNNIKVAFFLNLSFSIIEIIGGLYTNSIAILSDALHDLGDSLSLGIAWYFEHIAQRKETPAFSYGFKRYSVVGAIINAVVLIVGSIFIFAETIPRLIAPEAVNTQGMIWIAILGVFVNGAAVFKLRKSKNMNQKVIATHLLEDVLGWVAVLIGALVMNFYDVPIIDPLLSALIALYILYNVIRNTKETLNIVLQKTPPQFNRNTLAEKLCRYEQIVDMHDLHIWSMDGEYNVLTAHLVLKENMEIESLSNLKKQIREDLRQEEIHHVTIEFETINEECSAMM